MKSSKETTKLKMCILCEKKEKADSFLLNERFCEKCWRSNKNEFLHNYEWNFNYDLFYLKYPGEKPIDWGKIDIYASLNKLENELKRDKKLLPVYQERGIRTEQEIQEMKDNIVRLEKEIAELKKFQTYQTYQEQK